MGVEVGEQRLRALRPVGVKADLNPDPERALEGRTSGGHDRRRFSARGENGCSGGSEALKPSDLRPVLTGGPVERNGRRAAGLERGTDHRGGARP
jgi:hypothetical protein